MVVNASIYLANITAGHPIAGVFDFYNVLFGGYFLFLLWATFRIMLAIKVKNALTGWIVTMIFFAVYIGNYYNTQLFTSTGLAIIFLVITIELASTIYSSFIK